MGKVSCEMCKKKCKKEAVRLEDKYFHLKCFACDECKKPLSVDGFYAHKGGHYCAEDYQKLFSTKCRGCGEVAVGEVITVMGNTYHQHCFSCSKCGKKFTPGEKVTFADNAHLCHACVLKSPAVRPPGGAQRSTSPRKPSPHAMPVERPASKSPGPQNSPPQAWGDSAMLTSQNRSALSSSPTASTKEEKNGLNESERLNMINGGQSPSSSSSTGYKPMPTKTSLPKVFGMPDNKFYNMSYLERTGEFKRGGAAVGSQINGTGEAQPVSRHYHRPENFSYTKNSKDFKPDRPDSFLGSRKESKNADEMNNANLAPIERDDWPGPPEPAAAYPELLREKSYRRKSFTGSDIVTDGRVTPKVEAVEDAKISKDIEELSKIPDSGAAAVILRDLRKKRSTSPTLDPWNASRTPSAATEPMSKTRYETPYFASPSRDLDAQTPSHRRSRSSEDGLMDRSGARSADITRSYVVTPRPGYTMRPGSSVDNRNSYHDGIDYDRRPQSSAAMLQSNNLSEYRPKSVNDEEYDPNTGLRHSHSSHLRAMTLPSGMSPNYIMDSRLTPIPRGLATESVKIYSYAQLKSENAKQLPGVDKEALERNLNGEEFQTIFSMSKEEFYRQPAWKRTDLKTRVGLI